MIDIPQAYLDEAVRRFQAEYSNCYNRELLWRSDDWPVRAHARTLQELGWQPPVDPMLVRAREIVAQTLTPENHQRCNCREKITAGEWDDTHKVRIALIALREGMGE